MAGPFTLTPAARSWGKEWYEHFWTYDIQDMDDTIMEGYAARKQTHLHKVAMVLSASRSNNRIIEKADLATAQVMLQTLEPDMRKVFSKIGRTEDSLQTERLLDFVRKKKTVPYATAYQYVHTAFPDVHNFEGILNGLVRAGYVELESISGEFHLRSLLP